MKRQNLRAGRAQRGMGSKYTDIHISISPVDMVSLPQSQRNAQVIGAEGVTLLVRSTLPAENACGKVATAIESE